MTKKKVKKKATPIRKGLKDQGPLQELVQDGLQALKQVDKSYINSQLRNSFADSLDIDEAMRTEHPNANRWDYLLGYPETGKIYGLEPHSASNGEISVVIGKRQSCKDQIREHLRSEIKVSAWFWVASGKVDFMPMDKATIRLAENGITFVDKKLLKKHLD